MKNFYEIGTVLQINGKNYEVVQGSGDDLYNTCGKCALYGGKPGTCLLSTYPDLVGNCSAYGRPDGTDVHYKLTDREASVFYNNNGEEIEEARAVLPKPTDEEKEILKNESVSGWVSDDEENPDNITRVGNMQTLCEPETPKQLKEPVSVKPPQLSVVKAKNENGDEIGGLLVTDENGNKYIIPYGSKVLMDGTCNLFSFVPNTLKCLTQYKDMDGNAVYTGDKLKVLTFGNSTREYIVKTVTCKKMGVIPLFYEEGNGSHSDDVKVVDNQIINGTIVGEKNENEKVLDWFASVKEALFKLIGSMSEIGNEEFKTIYRLFNVEEFLKKTTIEN